ncbi:TRAP transporter small permease [Desulfoluna spongiiphila]|uniref:TRAP-type C4-dicarboxylate transport system, small permease component n=1 Tax=Desulfoluna spongiiphila TaxID=419481 RepID=A0A1G5C125_9BACT|nr:TRAP transporter small permease [Desulfoluna spongiiphila]SCX96112.1 TRAP-type C4-dicarboxylate transport system, small permease component [Desulfoluna spongiiphila]VVS94042.1 trap transporter small membrane protein dctq [Desulfoluna spongiiphila]
MIKSTKSIINRSEEIFSSLALVMMTGITVVQVFNRYVLQNSLDWSEEIARYLFIWAVYVGCSYATQMNRHLEVTVIRNMFGGKFARPVTILAHLCTVVFCACATFWGIKFIMFLSSTGQKTPALEVQMYWVFLSVPVGMGLMALRTLERLWGVITGKYDPSIMEIN